LYGTTGATTSRKTPVRRFSAALLMRIVVLAPAAYTGIKSADCDYARSKRIESFNSEGWAGCEYQAQ
jgi:hypothetical protein